MCIATVFFWSVGDDPFVLSLSKHACDDAHPASFDRLRTNGDRRSRATRPCPRVVASAPAALLLLLALGRTQRTHPTPSDKARAPSSSCH